MANGIIIDLDLCVGCWTCSMVCKMAYDRAVDDWPVYVRSIGDGSGIDEPAGVYPDLSLSWMPVHTKQCSLCAARTKDGELPYCVYNCTTQAMSFGDMDDPESDFSKRKAKLAAKGDKIFELPAWEGARSGIVYAEK